MNFAPLHVRTGYSFLKSGLTIDNLFLALKKNKYDKVGITDIHTLYGLPSFVNYGLKYHYKTALGIEVTAQYQEQVLSFCLYAEDENGYLQLIALASYLSNHNILPLKKFDCSHLLAIMSSENECLKNEINRVSDIFTHFLLNISKCFSHFFIGLENYHNKSDEYIQKLREFADKYKYEVVAFPLICYEKKEDDIALKIVKAIEEDKHLTSFEENGIYYLRAIEELQELYTEEELSLSENIFNYINVDFYQKRGHLLSYPSITSSYELLKELSIKGLKEKGLNNPQYQDRLFYELDIIDKMGYSDYFLIVQDYVNYAKENDIPVGPGRGSAASSLVSFALNITSVDPIKYHLLFESFLNPARVSMPDIDIDFGDNKREKVIEYIKDKFGANRVASIVTFQTIGAKQSIRDIGRVYNFSSSHIDLLAKSITNNQITLREAYRTIPAFRQLVDSDQYYLNIVRLAKKIEGLPRQAGLHAAGIVLNNEELSKSLPVTISENGHYTTQYEMTPLADQGFLKMDLLGLRNLTIIDTCIKKINAQFHTDFTIENIPFENDEKIFDIISKNKTMGIFQLESNGIRKAISTLKPSSFDDVVALLALFRPGPIENIPVYARRKEGEEKITYFDDSLKDILAPTYGIIVYQEQVLQVVEKVASFTLSEADLFRRAISKKDAQKLISMKEKFINGALKNGYSLKTANQIYDHIYRFADYGFKKAHSVAYAMISCKMAYLKAYYPLYFYASLFEGSSSTSDNKFITYISEMKSMDLKFLPPSINESIDVFDVKNNGLLLPLSSIKGIPSLIVKAILDEREKGDFKNICDFIIRMYDKNITMQQIKNLIYAGAFDSLHSSRISLIEALSAIMEYASMVFHTYQVTSSNDDFFLPPPIIKEKVDEPLSRCENEIEVLGIMLTETPLFYLQNQIKVKGLLSIKEFQEKKMLRSSFVGILKTMKVIKTKKGEPMAFLLFFDDEKEQEVVLFPKEYAQYYQLLVKNKIYIVNAHYEKENSCIANEIKLWED